MSKPQSISIFLVILIVILILTLILTSNLIYVPNFPKLVTSQSVSSLDSSSEKSGVNATAKQIISNTVLDLINNDPTFYNKAESISVPGMALTHQFEIDKSSIIEDDTQITLQIKEVRLFTYLDGQKGGGSYLYDIIYDKITNQVVSVGEYDMFAKKIYPAKQLFTQPVKPK